MYAMYYIYSIYIYIYIYIYAYYAHTYTHTYIYVYIIYILYIIIWSGVNFEMIMRVMVMSRDSDLEGYTSRSLYICNTYILNSL